MVCTRAGDDRIPDDSLIRSICRRPRSGHVDEDLFRVPGEEGGEVGGEGEADVCVFFLLSGVVVWSAPDAVAVYVLVGTITTDRLELGWDR